MFTRMRGTELLRIITANNEGAAATTGRNIRAVKSIYLGASEQIRTHAHTHVYIILWTDAKQQSRLSHAKTYIFTVHFHSVWTVSKI